jgi:hypothetical protein
MVKTIKGEREIYLNKAERRKLADGLIYFIERSYVIEDVERKEGERLIPLHEFGENQFYEPLKKEEEGLSDIERIVFRHSKFKPFPLIFESVNDEISVRKHALQNVLNSLEEKGYISKLIIPTSLNLLLHCIEINTKIKEGEMYIKLFPGKIVYKLEENEIFFECVLDFLRKFHKIKQKLEVEDLFGPIEKSVDIIFYGELKEIYNNFLKKYQIIEHVEKELQEPTAAISLKELEKLQEMVYKGELPYEKFEEQFTKLLEAVERGEYVGVSIIKSDMFSKLEEISNAAKILAQKNLPLYNDLVENYNKMQKYSKEQQINCLIDFYIKKKKILNEENLKILKDCIKEIIDNIKNKP